MPYQWLPPTDAAPTRLRLWPHRSLPRRGFVGFVGVTALLLSLPLLTQLGTAGLWVLLPFLLAAIAGLWLALEHSYKTGRVVEDLTLTPTSLSLHRQNPRAPAQSWDANPHWVRVTLHPTTGPVPNYLTLAGNGREVELGAFLTPDERASLHASLHRLLSEQRGASH